MNTLCDFYITTLSYDWDMNKDMDLSLIDRSFDPDKIRQYLSLFSDDIDKQFIQELLDKTIYVNFDWFKNALHHSFIKFHDSMKDTEFYILTSMVRYIGDPQHNYSASSNDWIVAILWPYIRQMKIKGFFNQRLDQTKLDPGTYHFVLFDDSSYSGGNVMSFTDEFIFNFSQELGIDNMKLRENGYYFNFHIVIPFISTLVEENFSAQTIEKYLDYNVILYNTYSIKGLNEEIDLSKYYGKYYNLRPGDISGYDEILYNKFEIQVPNRPMLYFDHKSAGPTSTYSVIYVEGKIPENGNFGPLFKNLPSRYKIEQLDALFIQYTNNTRQIKLIC